MRWIALAFACAAAFAQDAGLPKEVLLLSRIRRAALENLERMPNYVCLETISRFYQLPGKRGFTPIDRIAIEVAHLEGKELFAWPGQDAFQEKTPADLLRTGASSSGEFALFLRTIFLNKASTIRYIREEKVGRARAARYDFSVPAFAAALLVRSETKSGVAAAHGSFWADPRSCDLLRIEIHAGDIPPDIEFVAASNLIDYRRVRIGRGEILLPRESEMRLTQSRGTVLRNVTNFTRCREYAGTSTIRFGDDVPAAAPAPPPVEKVELPAGLTILAELRTPLEPERAVIGGLVRLRVSEPAGGVPKDAEITGRIFRIERRPEGEVLVAIAFTELSYGNNRAVFRARFDGFEDNPRRSYVRFSPLQLEPELRQPGTAALFITNRGLARGLVLVWRT